MEARVDNEMKGMMNGAGAAAPVLVFRTPVQHGAQVELLRPQLDLLMHGGGEWNFDLEDRDRILRVDSPELVRERVQALLEGHGFTCTELE